jgi:hypothetical protein
LTHQSETVVRVVVDLTAMVEGGAGKAQEVRRVPAASGKTVRKPKASSGSLAALQKAVAKPAKPPVASPVAAGQHAAEKAFPLDDHFEEF